MKILSSTRPKSNRIVVAMLLTTLLISTQSLSINVAAAAPVADFTFNPAVGNTSSIIKFNASSSSNPGGNLSDLSFRWDWQDDGIFDTSWSSNYTAEHRFTSPGLFQVRLEVKNLTGGISNATAVVPIDGSPPVVTLLLPDGSAFRNGSRVDPGHASITCLSIDEMSSIVSVEFSLDASDFVNASLSPDLNQTTITLNGLADGDHYLIVQVTNSAGLSTLVGVDFTASAAVAQEPPLDVVWIIVTLLVVAIGVTIFFFLITRR
jgi:PKD repeat protein